MKASTASDSSWSSFSIVSKLNSDFPSAICTNVRTRILCTLSACSNPVQASKIVKSLKFRSTSVISQTQCKIVYFLPRPTCCNTMQVSLQTRTSQQQAISTSIHTGLVMTFRSFCIWTKSNQNIYGLDMICVCKPDRRQIWEISKCNSDWSRICNKVKITQGKNCETCISSSSTLRNQYTRHQHHKQLIYSAVQASLPFHILNQFKIILQKYCQIPYYY